MDDVTLLDSTPDNGPPLEAEPTGLQAVRAYRRAARAIIEAGLPATGMDGWRVQLVKLAIAAHAKDLPVREYAAQAIRAEALPLFGVDPDEGWAKSPPPAFIDPRLKLRNEGHEICPTCTSPLPTAADFEYWARLRLTEAKRRDERKAACDG